MKKILNNAGVTAFQTEFFQLTLTEQQFLIAQIRSDFALFMNDYFDLHINQVTQIGSMPTTFKATLAEGIASTWEAQLHVSLTKRRLTKMTNVESKILLSPVPHSPQSTVRRQTIPLFTPL
ncbi:hypothetical protein OKW96_12150 [Sphingobacterium sp. KU25419]|nr:hypothetical protein OKW96_12150 [Sphingobacterium sp. KU25419]